MNTFNAEPQRKQSRLWWISCTQPMQFVVLTNFTVLWSGVYGNVIQRFIFRWPKYTECSVVGHRGMQMYCMKSRNRYSHSHQVGSGLPCVHNCSFWMAAQTVAGGWSGACTLYPHPRHHSALACNAIDDIETECILKHVQISCMWLIIVSVQFII